MSLFPKEFPRSHPTRRGGDKVENHIVIPPSETGLRTVDGRWGEAAIERTSYLGRKPWTAMGLPHWRLMTWAFSLTGFPVDRTRKMQEVKKEIAAAEGYR